MDVCQGAKLVEGCFAKFGVLAKAIGQLGLADGGNLGGCLKLAGSAQTKFQIDPVDTQKCLVVLHGLELTDGGRTLDGLGVSQIGASQ